jgi:hypothetical protein
MCAASIGKHGGRHVHDAPDDSKERGIGSFRAQRLPSQDSNLHREVKQSPIGGAATECAAPEHQYVTVTAMTSEYAPTGGV